MRRLARSGLNILIPFVERPKSIDVRYFDRPYLLVPDKHGQKGYVLLREAIASSGKAGMRNVVYKIRYRNGVEVKRTVVSSKVTDKAVAQIVEVERVRAAVVGVGAGGPCGGGHHLAHRLAVAPSASPGADQ